jgi:ubiquinone/menaquinone biosynthesis C-methylase UbiE
MSVIKTSDQLQENYDNYYASEDAEWRRLGALDKADNIVRLCGPSRPRSILEIGAGDGSILARLTELHFGEEYYAAEISSSGVAAILARGIPGLVEATLFDGYQLAYEDAKFDVAILSHVVEHVEFPRQLLYEASRVARYVFVEVPLEDISRQPKEFVFDKVGHINHYSPRTIRWLLQSSNLRVLEQIVTNPSRTVYKYAGGNRALVHYYIKQGLLSLFPRLATQHLSYHCAALCEKQSLVVERS